MLVFVLMATFATLIWIGMGKNPIDSTVVARVWTYFKLTLLLTILCWHLEHCFWFIMHLDFAHSIKNSNI